MSLALPFTVTGAGPPSFFTGYDFTGAVLTGGLTAHHGVVIGAACRLVEDPASPLRFVAIGEHRYDRRRARLLDATRRWVVLAADMGVLRAHAHLFGKPVRIEYAVTP